MKLTKLTYLALLATLPVVGHLAYSYVQDTGIEQALMDEPPSLEQYVQPKTVPEPDNAPVNIVQKTRKHIPTVKTVQSRAPVYNSQRPVYQMPVRRVQAQFAPVRKCVNLGNALEAPNEGDWGYTVNNQDLRRIKQLGFDTIRLPVKWTAHMKRRSPHQIDPKLLARTDSIINTALGLGLKVILDVHNYDAIMERPDREISKLKNLWHQLSRHYANWPDGLIFEVLNEARDNLTTAKSNVLNEELLAIIRRTNPKRWVVLGSGNWGSLDPLLASTQEKFNPPNDPRIITTFHYYDEFDFTHQGAHFLDNPPARGTTFGSAKQKSDIAKHMAQARAFQDRTGHPLLLGEFGVYQHVPTAQRAHWTHTVRREAEANGLGWCYWDWATEFKMFDQNTARLVPGFEHALFK